MKVNEIFKSIDGEGKRAGLPTTFIRLCGCNLRCNYCDTTYAFDSTGADDMSVDDIIESCINIDIRSITITGGEPLVHPAIHTLLATMDRSDRFDINVETNGTVDPSIYHHLKNVWFTVDYKCPSSGEEARMIDKAFTSLRDKDVLKFVVGSDEDLNRAAEIIHRYNPSSQIYLSPVFGYEPKHIVEFMLEKHLYNCKVQLQMHKIIWDPNMRGV